MLYFHGKMGVEQAALSVHKVMSYSDAGSAFILVRWLGRKWMSCLTVRVLFAFRVLPADFSLLRSCLLYYIGVMGLLIRILGSAKALNISKIESLLRLLLFSSGKMRSAIVKPFIDRMNRNELFTAIVADGVHCWFDDDWLCRNGRTN